MSQSNLTELEDLKIIYYEIVAGSTYINELNAFIKHFSELDNIEISKTKHQFLQKYIQEGIPTYEERLKVVMDNGDWSDKDEKNITFLRTLIVDNEKNVKVIREQQQVIAQVIKEKKENLAEILFKKRNIIGATAEEFSERDTINYMAYKGFYKDSQCKIKLFEKFEDFQNLSDEECDTYVESMDEALTKFTEKTIRTIAAMPFFINIFSYVKEDVSKFFQKAMIELSNYQFLLLSLGSRNLGVLTNTEGQPPEIVTDNDIQKVIEFYDLEYSVLLGKRKSSKH